MSRASSMEVKTPMEAPENLVEYRITRSKGVFGGVSYELRGSGRTPLLAATRAAMSQTFVISMQRRRLGAVDAVPRKAKLKTALVFNLEDKRRKDPVAIREGFKRVERWTKHIDLFNKARLLQKHTTPATVVRKACNRSSTRLQPQQHAPATVAARACNRPPAGLHLRADRREPPLDSRRDLQPGGSRAR